MKAPKLAAVAKRFELLEPKGASHPPLHSNKKLLFVHIPGYRSDEMDSEGGKLRTFDFLAKDQTALQNQAGRFGGDGESSRLERANSFPHRRVLVAH